MKKIIVVALYEEISLFYKKHIKAIFGNLVDVECFCLEHDIDDTDLEADLILASSDIIFEHIKNINKRKIETIIIKRTFSKTGFNKIKDLHYDGEILFVSTFYELAVESIAQLYELGICDLKFIPYNPLFQNDQNAHIKMAVTAGDIGRVPASVEHIINIENRVLDITTIADIGVKLNIPSKRMADLLESYENNLIVTNSGFKRMMDKTGELKKQLNTILSFIADSIIAVDTDGNISEYNAVSESIFAMKKSDVNGMSIENFFNCLKVKDSHNKKEIDLAGLLLRESATEEITENVLVHISGTAIVINKYPLKQEDRSIGVLFVSKKYIEVENEHNRLRSKLIPKGHVARYTFENVLGNSGNIKKLKSIAEKMAKSASTILITGESGTGKEVFAQAIHNASDRKNGPFLAINCSALAASLLESELFGYEEGAFTGAKKGGRVGLFELANGGTIFLDEIGELPYDMQAKLLRVLMEKEIMRVGGTDVIHVDARVISATNKDLKSLANQGLFRQDLYYRLNVLPLRLPPLRERPEDILILAEKFFEDFGRDKTLSKDAKKILRAYSWPGNIRELRNCIEYMYQMSENVADVEDIPEYINEKAARSRSIDSNMCNGKGSDAGVAKGGLAAPWGYEEKEELILRILFFLNSVKRSAGRKTISEEAGKSGISIAEQEVRFVLKRLEEKGLVQVNQGKRGCFLTEQGTAWVLENKS